MRSGFFYLITGLILASSQSSFAQTETSEIPVSSATELPTPPPQEEETDNATETEETYTSKYIALKQFEEVVIRLSCQVDDFDNELFTSKSPCFKNMSVTPSEEECLQSNCCYIEELNHDGTAGCIKKQSSAYILSIAEESDFLLTDGSNRKKQSPLSIAAATFVDCVARRNANCRMGLGAFTVTELSELVRDAILGEATSVGIITDLGINFVRALISENLVSQLQGQSLLSLFPQTCFWYPWGGWGNCEGICGTGVQTRIRRCQGCVPGTGGCQGECVRKRACPNPVGQICGYWSGWTEFGACSVTCNQGVRTRTRRCLGGRVGETGCIGPTQNQINCFVSGEFRSWTTWGPCDQSCGPGTQTRVQTHTCTEPARVENRGCNLQPCCTPLPWSQFSACSTSCGPGTMSRTRGNTCPSIPIQVESANCNLGNGNWGDWSPFGDCSGTCSGIQIRSRSNPCVADPQFENRQCVVDVGLTPWTSFGPCSLSCPGGVETRTRRNPCTNEVFTDTQPCAQRDPDFGPWTQFGPCSSTCAGMRERRQFDPCGGPPNRDEEQCPINLFWTPWGSWSACSQSCAGGTQTRNRVRPCTGQNESQTRNCGVSGSWGVYSSWSVCSVSCGTGSQFRTRIHSCPNVLLGGNGVEREVRECSTNPCCRFLDWSTWTSCTVSCDYGVVTRNRRNICPDIAPMQERRFCFTSAGSYTAWNQWTACTQTCPGGSRVRTRTQTCSGETENQVQNCGNLETFSPWSAWTTCSRTCGGGMQSRQRFNNCDRTEFERQNRECNTDPGQFNPPGPWSSCTSSCTGGTRFRLVTHSCGVPTRRDTEPCGVSGTFLDWIPWTQCSTSCPGGFRSRSRSHQCTNQLQDENENCGQPGSFGPWSVWTLCSQLCAGGTQNRTRSHTCNGLSLETRNCGRAPFFGDWSLWGSCSVTCGSGQRVRRRRGFCGVADESESAVCATSECCIPLNWQSWGVCTVSCGIGQQSRQRFSTCSPTVPIDQTVRNCNAGNGVTSPWSSWTTCPVTCGGSQRSRTRTNTCADQPEFELEGCGGAPCPSWNPWSPWSACSVTCFDGSRIRRRECIGGQPGIDCPGPSQEDLLCNAGNGDWSPWLPWNACSATCGGGIRSRTRANTCGLPEDVNTESCNTQTGVFLSWSSWTICSATCGVGTRTRQRRQSCTGQFDLARESCDRFVGTWEPWTPWSACSASCGGGTSTRRRSHTCDLPDETENMRCNTFPGEFLLWSPWTQCSSTCGGGTRSRTRVHTCGIPDETMSGNCGTRLCPYWSGWTEFGPCSVSCGQGIRIRTRDCQAGVPGELGCLGDFRQAIECIEQQDPVPWESFGECSRSCGTGFMQRQRIDPCASEPERDVVVCNTDTGSWNNWGPWSLCTAQCGGGTTMRIRTHTCGRPDDVQSIPCNTDPGFWSAWTPWSACSANCGFGTNSRSRVQSCTGDNERATRPCQRTPCAIWGGWSTWGACSASCGPGTSARIRQCQGGLPGEGFCFTTTSGTEETRTCDAGDCCDFDWSGWSACCQYSPRPIQIRFLGNICGEPWVRENRTCPVGISPLPGITCDRLDVLFESADRIFAGFEEGARTAVIAPVRERVGEVNP